jgi:predicted aconitase/predicted aconitase with swiveling domain
MRITAPDFLKQSREIVELYTRLGVRPTQSCIPYEWEGVITSGTAAWSESNAICFGNSYCDLVTNRESGLSALACALTGYTPKYGLLEEDARRPNLEVFVSASMMDPTDFSILGDWIGKQRQPDWRTPYGPIPLIKGLPGDLDHEQRKALTAAAANYGSPMVYIEGLSQIPEPAHLEARLTFDKATLDRRYQELRPQSPVSLITIGCPQASIGEIRAVAQLLKGRQVTADPDDKSELPPLWIFTSSANQAIAEGTGLAKIIRDSGALLLENTCPEVVPYDPCWVKHILTNSMKAEHYLKSGLNSIPTSVMTLAGCIAIATGDQTITQEKLDLPTASDLQGPLRSPPRSRGPHPLVSEALTPSSPRPSAAHPLTRSPVHPLTSTPLHSDTPTSFQGRGLPSQGDFTVTGQAFVTDAPITLLGFVNRKTGVIEEPGHPADGRSMAGKIAIFPKGTGSTVAPYVLLELHYRGMAPIAIVNTEIDQQSAPACSLEGIPYAFGFDATITSDLSDGDTVELARRGEIVSLRVL